MLGYDIIVTFYDFPHLHTLPVKRFWTVRFFMFFKEFSSAHQIWIYFIKKQQELSIWNIYWNEIYSFDQSYIFSIITYTTTTKNIENIFFQDS